MTHAVVKHTCQSQSASTCYFLPNKAFILKPGDIANYEGGESYIRAKYFKVITEKSQAKYYRVIYHCK